MDNVDDSSAAQHITVCGFNILPRNGFEVYIHVGTLENAQQRHIFQFSTSDPDNWYVHYLEKWLFDVQGNNNASFVPYLILYLAHNRAMTMIDVCSSINAWA